MAYIDIRYMASLINKDNARILGLEKVIADYIYMRSGVRYMNLVPNSLIDFLIRYEELPEELFIQKGKNGEILSLNETVRERLKDDRRCGFFMDLVNPHQEIPQSECIGPEIRLAENVDPAAAVQRIGTELSGHAVEIQTAHAGEIFQQPVQSPAPVIRRGIGRQGAEPDRSEPFPVFQVGLGKFGNADVAFAPVIVISRRVA